MALVHNRVGAPAAGAPLQQGRITPWHSKLPTTV